MGAGTLTAVVSSGLSPKTLYGSDLELARSLCEPILATEGPKVDRIILFGSSGA